MWALVNVGVFCSGTGAAATGDGKRDPAAGWSLDHAAITESTADATAPTAN